MRTGGRAGGMTKLIVAFRNFAKAPENQFSFGHILFMDLIVSEKLSTVSFPLMTLLRNTQQTSQ
jgi:hypothetical protein